MASLLLAVHLFRIILGLFTFCSQLQHFLWLIGLQWHLFHLPCLTFSRLENLCKYCGIIIFRWTPNRSLETVGLEKVLSAFPGGFSFLIPGANCNFEAVQTLGLLHQYVTSLIQTGCITVLVTIKILRLALSTGNGVIVLDEDLCPLLQNHWLLIHRVVEERKRRAKILSAVIGSFHYIQEYLKQFCDEVFMMSFSVLAISGSRSVSVKACSTFALLTRRQCWWYIYVMKHGNAKTVLDLHKRKFCR